MPLKLLSILRAWMRRYGPALWLAAALVTGPAGARSQTAEVPRVPPPTAPAAPAAPAVSAPVVSSPAGMPPTGGIPTRAGGAPAAPGLAPAPALAVPASGAPSRSVSPAPASSAGAAKRLFRLEGTLSEEGGQAVAINADESLLAVAREDGNATQIAIFDRPSRTRIGLISAKVGGQPRIAFAPHQDLLLVAGNKSVQLWDVPIVPLKPDQPLDEKYRLWDQPLSGSGGTPQIAFAEPPTHVMWSRGSALFRREAAAASSPADKPLWQAEGSERRTLGGFSFARNKAGLAVSYAGEKGVDLLDARTLTLLGSLQGHRFPVAGIVHQGRGWLSLDTGWHALRWNENLQGQESTFLESLPRTAEPLGLSLLGAKHVLISVPGEGGVQRLVTSPPAWRVEDKLLATPDGIAQSPTGRYVLVLEGAKGDQVKVYGFAAPESPLDYVRRLQAAKAYRAAQGYVRLLDESGLSPKLKSSLLSELGQVPASVKVQDFQERLARARRDGNADGIRHWAEQVLNLRPQDADALAALQDLKTEGERRILNQAREALKQGQTSQVISILSTQIPADSPLRDEAAALIRQAEAQRRVAGLLTQAREQMNLGNYPAATALAQEALRDSKDNPAAQSLLSDIQERSGAGSYPRWLPIVLGMLLALTIVAFLLHRNRGRLMPLFRKAEPAGTSPWGGLGRPPLDNDYDALQGVSPHGGSPQGGGPSGDSPRPSPRPAPMGPSGAGPRPVPRGPAAGSASPARDSGRAAKHPSERKAAPGARAQERSAERMRPSRPEASPARLQVVEELLQRTEDMMRLAQQADVAREHTSLLMEVEAELAAFHRRVTDPAVDLGPIHQRLKTVGVQLRELKFTRREAPPAKPQATGEPTWYEVLQVHEAASEAEIRASYLQLLKQYHPDLHNHSGFPWVKEQAERMTKKIGAAYQVLGSADKRLDYDRELRRRRSESAQARTR